MVSIYVMSPNLVDIDFRCFCCFMNSYFRAVLLRVAASKKSSLATALKKHGALCWKVGVVGDLVFGVSVLGFQFSRSLVSDYT